MSCALAQRHAISVLHSQTLGRGAGPDDARGCQLLCADERASRIRSTSACGTCLCRAHTAAAPWQASAAIERHAFPGAIQAAASVRHNKCQQAASATHTPAATIASTGQQSKPMHQALLQPHTKASKAACVAVGHCHAAIRRRVARLCSGDTFCIGTCNKRHAVTAPLPALGLCQCSRC